MRVRAFPGALNSAIAATAALKRAPAKGIAHGAITEIASVKGPAVREKIWRKTAGTAAPVLGHVCRIAVGIIGVLVWAKANAMREAPTRLVETVAK
jgi:hypothetical protein